jgi:hypothetical protein
MAIVIAALLPVFLLIVLGFVLKRSLMRLETQWHGLERLTYYVLFPALLIQTLVKADLSSVRDRPARHRRRPAPRRHVPPEPGRQRRRVSQADRDARARDRTGAVVRPFRLQSRDRGGMLGGAGVVERLRAGPADGRRRAPAGRKSSRCRPFSRPSPCRSRLRWWRRSSLRAQRSIEQQSKCGFLAMTGERHDPSTRSREPHGLQRRGEVVEAVQDGGQPGRIAAIAEIAEQ